MRPSSVRSSAVRRPGVLVVVVLVGVVALQGCGGGGDDDTATTATRVRIDEARVLNDLIADGRATTAHVVYAVTDPAEKNPPVTVETWRSPPKYRYDHVSTVAGKPRRDIQVDDGVQLIGCTQAAAAPTCTQRVAKDAPPTAASAALTPGDLARAFVFKVTQAGTTPDLEPADTEIAGQAARCYAANGVGELCLTDEGVVVRLVLGDLEVEATAVDTEVPDSVFAVG